MLFLNRFRKGYSQSLAKIFLPALLCISVSVTAATPAGTVITNQAKAVFKDSNGVEYTVVSNVVETLIEQVASIDLTQDRTQLAASGTRVYIPHMVVNTGNGDDQFDLSVNNEPGDNGDLLNLAIYADLDQNGVADNDTLINSSPTLAANSSFSFIVAGTVPEQSSSGNIALLSVEAVSQFNSSVKSSNTDTIQVDEGATVVLTKSLSAYSGVSPSGPYTVVLEYENNGADVAFDVVLIDALPEGMEYVPGSAQWDLSNQPLTDANPTDVVSGGGQSLQYCAYDSSCINIPEAQLDPDSDSTNQVTAYLPKLEVGQSGKISFDIMIADNVPVSTIANQAEVEFSAGGVTPPRRFSNRVIFSVQKSVGVVANGSPFTAIDGMSEPVSILTAVPGEYFYFDNIIWNTGNEVDTFNIELNTATATFPPGTNFLLVVEDRSAALADTNFDGIVDTGPVQPGEYATVALRVLLPGGTAGNNNGVGFDIEKVARSLADPTLTSSVVDHLDKIANYDVDITVDAQAVSPPALGTGTGPEASPVKIAIVDNQGRASFDLYISHQGSDSVSYELRAQSGPSGGNLPNNWDVVFTDGPTGTVITQTQTLQLGEWQHVIATVSTPYLPEFSSQSVYFVAEIPNFFDFYSIRDVVNTEVKFVRNPDLSLSPDSQAQVNQGGSVVYEHVLTNIGNIDLNDIEFDLLDSNENWQSTLFADTDQNGFLSPDDSVINGVFSLQRGESADIFLKVFAPTDSTNGQSNTSTLIAQSAIEAIALEIADTTTVSESQVNIVKEQAVDVGCDGQPDAGSGFTKDVINVAPGNNCVIYRLTASNSGTQPSYNVVIRDYTPPFTRYYPSAACSRTPCWINEPKIDETGTINAETDELLPGDAYSLQFSVRVQ